MRLLRGLLALSVVLAPAVASAQNVLFYGDAHTGGFGTTSAANGWTTTYWNSGGSTMTAAQLSAYDVLVVGWYGGTSSYAPVTGSTSGLNAVRGNRTFLTGQDADFHEENGSNAPAAQLFVSNAVNWAAAGTGLGVVVLAAPTFLNDPSSFLFAELAGYTGSGSGNNVIIPGPSAGYPVNAGLTSADLSNWNSSYHMTFDVATPGYSTINLSGDFCGATCAVTILTESEASGGTTSTPEPASMVLLGTGLVGIIGFARRKRSA